MKKLPSIPSDDRNKVMLNSGNYGYFGLPSMRSWRSNFRMYTPMTARAARGHFVSELQ
jgi:hypothetical protein